MKKATAAALVCLLLLICSAALAMDIPKSIGFQLPATWDEALRAVSLNIIDTIDIEGEEWKSVHFMPSALGTPLTCMYYGETDELRFGQCLFLLDHTFYYSSGSGLIASEYDVKGSLIQYRIYEYPGGASSDGSTQVTLTFSVDGELRAIGVNYNMVGYTFVVSEGKWTCSDKEKPTDTLSLPFDTEKLRDAANQHNANIHIIQTPSPVTAVPATPTPTATPFVTPAPTNDWIVKWTCVNCGTPQSDKSMYCANCGAQKNCWCCKFCYTWNDKLICVNCHHVLQDSLELILEDYMNHPDEHAEQIDAIHRLLDDLNTDSVSYFELPDGQWICLNCDALQDLSNMNCTECGAQQNTWVCLGCFTWNSNSICSRCHKTIEDTLLIRLERYMQNPEEYEDRIQALEYVLDTMMQQ